MKKYFIITALAVIAMTAITACSSDDSDTTPEYKAQLNKPAQADQAVQFQLTQPLASNAEDPAEKPLLTAIDITESGKVILEFHSPQRQAPVYVMEDVAINGDSYTFSGSQAQGTIQRTASNARITTRAGSDELRINITVTAIDQVTLSYSTEEGETVATIVTTPVSTDEALSNLARTWNILGAMIDVNSSDIKAYEEFTSRGGIMYLKDILDEALAQGINLSEKEQHDFDKQIRSVTITKSGLFTIDYADGTEDAAGWRWTNDTHTQFTITLKGEDMGNKFIVTNSNIAIAYNGNRCNLKLHTSFTDNSDKQWEVALTLKLQSAE